MLEGSRLLAASELARLHVLLIDDEDLVLRAMQTVLSGRMKVATVRSGDEAIGMLAVVEYDVVVCDVRMPGLSGPGIHRWIQEHRPGLESRIVFMSGDSFDAVTSEFLARIGAPCLQKPFSVAGLVRTISAVVRADRQLL